MHQVLTTIAASESSGGFFEALGIDWTLLVIQTLAFLVLMWLLIKFVYPPLNRMLERREADIEASVQAAKEAEQKADETKAEMDKILKRARGEASDIVTTAKEEASAIVANAETKSKERAEHIVAEAHEQIEKDIIAARKTLHNETLELVALATEKVVGNAVDTKVDNKLITEAVKGAK